MTTFDEQARAEAAQLETTWERVTFRAGARWAKEYLAARQPSVDDLAELVREEMVAAVGECICHEAYTSRNMRDPHCGWHNLGEGFDHDIAARVLALFHEANNQGEERA